MTFLRTPLLFILSFCAMSACAQITTATLSGTVKDADDAKIPGATITATNEETKLTRSVVSKEDGSYQVDFLPVGAYSLKVEAPGFKASVREHVVLTLNANATVDATMAPGSTSESINVTSEVPLLQISNATLGRTVTNVEVDNLPIVNRNVYDLLALTPGVQSSTTSTSLGYPAQIVAINGGTDNLVGSVTYYLDGGVNMTMIRNTGNVLPNPDALREFNVQTNNYSALYGRMSSGLVNVVTKSGTNQVHGSVFEFHRETAFSATPAFSLVKPPLHRNQFGATLGGPLWHDRTFFFGSYAGLREVTSSTLSSALVPTSAQRNGDFSENLPSSGTPASCPANTSAVIFVLCDPVTRKPVPGNRLTPAQLDPTVQKLLALVPLPNTTSVDSATGRATHGYTGNLVNSNNADEFLIKVDQTLGKHLIEAMYFNTSGLIRQSAGGNIPWSTQNFSYRQQNAILSDTWTLSPKAINQAYLNYTRVLGVRLTSPGRGLETFGSSFTTQGLQSLPQLSVTGYFTAAQAIGGPLTGTNFYSVRDVLSLTFRKHTFAFGGETSLNKDVQYSLLNNYGVFSFTASSTARTGAALSDFIVGLPNSMNQDSPSNGTDNSFFTGVFAQDDWRLTPTLTLNLGLRWDVQTPPTDPYNRQSTYIAGQKSTVYPTAPTGLVVVGDQGVPRGITETRWHHVSPRMGFAWDPFDAHRTVVRGAAGLFFGSVSGNEWNGTSNYQPFTVRNKYAFIKSMTDVYGDARSFPNGNPYPYYYDPKNPKPLVTPAQINGIDRAYQWPYTYQANLAVQQALSSSLAMTVTYVFSGNHNAPFGIDANYPLLTTSAAPINGVTTNTTNNYDARRPLQDGLGIINLIQSKQRTHYHGLQLFIEKRMTSQLSLAGFYTWSKTLSTAGENSSSAVIGSAEDYSRLDLEYGSSDTDIRHQANLSVVWKPKLLTHGPRAALYAINGWTLSGIANVRSGLPFTVTTGVDNNFDGNVNDRANLSGTADVGIRGGRSRAEQQSAYFNPAAFCSFTGSTASCPSGTGGLGLDGTTRRNGYFGPGSRNLNAALFRDFSTFGRVKLQFRAEVNNVFNLVNLGTPSATLSSGGNTGKITSASGVPRQIQLGARILF